MGLSPSGYAFGFHAKFEEIVQMALPAMACLLNPFHFFKMLLSHYTEILSLPHRRKLQHLHKKQFLIGHLVP
jgi:hypothetical protein